MPHLITLLLLLIAIPLSAQDTRPNILLCIADDWGWPHAGVYGDPAAQTPTFDRLAAQGVRFQHAYVASPSCTPSRAALLTGQWHWRLEESVNLWSTLRAEYAVYPQLLADAGYHTGSWRKGWGPGRLEPGGRTTQPAGQPYPGFAAFLDAHDDEYADDAPFCFWLGASDPHRGYQAGSGAASGIDPDTVALPACFPDHPTVRSDVADYLFEVRRFDQDVADALALLEARGELDNTLVVVTGDHGMPFPRCKGNLYDTGTRVCLAVHWPTRVPPGRVLTDFVSLIDLAPTFLDAAGIQPPEAMQGRSLLPLLLSDQQGRLDPTRDHILTGRERHTPAQAAPSTVGYPSRSLRTDGFLLIVNHAPDRWPAGVPEGSTRGRPYADCDNGPTKTHMLNHRDTPQGQRLYDLAFAPRPALELYDLAADPQQLHNVAADPAYADTLRDMQARLHAALLAADDPRTRGDDVTRWDDYPYYGNIPQR